MPTLRSLVLVGLLTCSACESSRETPLPADSPPTVEVVPATVLFRDITEESGVDFAHYPGEPKQFLLPEIMSPGCALLDYDQDGDLDLFLLNGYILL